MPNNTTHADRREQVARQFEDSIDAKRATLVNMQDALVEAADLLIDRLDAGSKVLSCGNGGSAGDAQHFSSELVNRFEHDRRALPAVALTTESSTLTAIANDDSYKRLFSRQIEALGQPGDILLAFSTSGNSANVVDAMNTARAQGLRTIAVTGKNGGTMADQLSSGDIELRVASSNTARIQEVHLLFIHCLCRFIENHLVSDKRQ